MYIYMWECVCEYRGNGGTGVFIMVLLDVVLLLLYMPHECVYVYSAHDVSVNGFENLCGN